MCISTKSATFLQDLGNISFNRTAVIEVGFRKSTQVCRYLHDVSPQHLPSELENLVREA
jgi:hypothetical protein